MIKITASIDTRSVNEVFQKLQMAGAKITKGLARRAVTASMRLPAAVAKAIAPIRKNNKGEEIGGALRHSLTTVVKIYPKNGIVWGALGARSKYKEAAPQGVKTKTGYVRPPLYEHLVEFGKAGVQSLSSAFNIDTSNIFVKSRYDTTLKAFKGSAGSASNYARRYASSRRKLKTNIIEGLKSTADKDGFLRPALRATSASMVETFSEAIKQGLPDVFNGKDENYVS